MNGIHDLGGMHGFGPIEPEPQGSEPLFHAAWERTVLGVALASFMSGQWSLDRFRKTIESEAPLDYLSRSYYERWLAALEELAQLPSDRPAAWAAVFQTDDPPRFQPGDPVRVLNQHPAGHTRAPRYVRGRRGVVEYHCGAEPLPELAAEGICRPRNLYRVRFDATELWGDVARPSDIVHLELWDDHLELEPTA